MLACVQDMCAAVPCSLGCPPRALKIVIKFGDRQDAPGMEDNHAWPSFVLCPALPAPTSHPWPSTSCWPSPLDLSAAGQPSRRAQSGDCLDTRGPRPVGVPSTDAAQSFAASA